MTAAIAAIVVLAGTWPAGRALRRFCPDPAEPRAAAGLALIALVGFLVMVVAS